MGNGLAIVRAIVEAHRGTISAENRLSGAVHHAASEDVLTGAPALQQQSPIRFP
jgi:signal transduction histidine kinase